MPVLLCLPIIWALDKGLSKLALAFFLLVNLPTLISLIMGVNESDTILGFRLFILFASLFIVRYQTKHMERI